MPSEKSKISPGFVVISCILVVVVSAFIYMKENKKFANADTVYAIVVGSRIVPKRCLIEAKAESGRYEADILRVSVPSWDSRKFGERIRVRVDRNDSSIVEVDEFLYLHRASLGVLAGTTILGIILAGVLIFKKR
jgi:hypothetical protein